MTLLQVQTAAEAQNIPDDNKLMVVAAVMVIIFLGIVVYLFILEKRLKNLEK
jgi:CcmD family protein